MNNHWERNTLFSRISDPVRKRRYPAGSPDTSEIAAYTAAFQDSQTGTAVILGMTPELRNLAARYFKRIVSIDESRQAIDLYSSWMDLQYIEKEKIICANWLDIEKYIAFPIDTFLGDGVFGNLQNIHEHRKLLATLLRLLNKNGRFITRKALIPRKFVPADHNFQRLMIRYRRGEIDAAEFGFGARLVGHYTSCYEPTSYILNNEKLFAKCRAAREQGLLSAHELELINRYYFSGRNCILPQEVWEQTLEEEGYDFRIHSCHGKAWYEYYVIYECFRSS